MIEENQVASREDWKAHPFTQQILREFVEDRAEIIEKMSNLTLLIEEDYNPQSYALRAAVYHANLYFLDRFSAIANGDVVLNAGWADEEEIAGDGENTEIEGGKH